MPAPGLALADPWRGPGDRDDTLLRVLTQQQRRCRQFVAAHPHGLGCDPPGSGIHQAARAGQAEAAQRELLSLRAAHLHQPPAAIVVGDADRRVRLATILGDRYLPQHLSAATHAKLHRRWVGKVEPIARRVLPDLVELAAERADSAAHPAVRQFGCGADAQIQRLTRIAVTPRQGRSAIKGDQIGARLDSAVDQQIGERMTARRLDRACHRLDRHEIGALTPQPEVAQTPAGRLDAHPARRTDDEAVGALLQVGEIGGRFLGGRRWRCHRRRAIAERDHGQTRLAECAGSAEQAQFVGAGFEQLVDAPVGGAGLTGELGRAGQHVDELDGGAGRAVGLDREPARRFDLQQRRVLAGGWEPILVDDGHGRWQGAGCRLLLRERLCQSR